MGKHPHTSRRRRSCLRSALQTPTRLDPSTGTNPARTHPGAGRRRARESRWLRRAEKLVTSEGLDGSPRIGQRIFVVGFGAIARAHHSGLENDPRRAGRASWHAVLPRHGDLPLGVEAHANMESMLAVDPRADDIVLVCTPPSTHAEFAIAALSSGRHVLVEKPLSTGEADAMAMFDAARL